MDRTLKAFSLVLSYPSPELQAAMPEIEAVFSGDERLTAAQRRALLPLTASLRDDDIYDLEERYVMLFDRSRTLSLNLFEHVHGESRDRGGAMVSLMETYRAGGFDPVTSELPDHLPILLEFLAMGAGAAARETLADAAHILSALAVRLNRRESLYAPVFDALVRLAGGSGNRAAEAELLAEPDTDPENLQALDAVWEESEVRFGPDPEAGCPEAREMMTRMAVPPRPGDVTGAE